MAQANQTKNSFTFVKGLITEASALIFPEDASLDEENFELNRNGSRSKRLGIDFEDDNSLVDSGHTDISTKDISSSTFLWENVAERGQLTFLVVQLGTFLTFHDISDSTTSISEGKKAFSIDLNSHKTASYTDISSFSVSMSAGKGFLFVNSKGMDPIYVKYNFDDNDGNGSITVVPYQINIRDFDGIEDGLEIDERPTTLRSQDFEAYDLHLYNLRNQGWPEKFLCASKNNGEGSSAFIDPVPHTFQTPAGDGILAFPSNADIIYLAKLSVAEEPALLGAYHPNELQKEVFGNTRAPRGHFILNAFSKDRADASGIAVVPTETEFTRPETSEFYSSRIWLASGSTVYFSQIIKGENRIDKFYQEADPTADEINDLVATDGGVIPIPDAGAIKQLITTRDKLIVLAERGVWLIDGADGPFTADNIRTYQISNVGVNSNTSAINVENAVVFSTSSGIYMIQPDDLSGEAQVQNMTESTIQSLYIDIPNVAQGNFVPAYDSSSRKVYWFYDSTGSCRCLNSVLVFDTVLGAFYKFKLDVADGTFPYITNGFVTREIKTRVEQVDLTTVLGFVFKLLSGEEITVPQTIETTNPTSLKMLTIVPQTSGNDDYTISEFSNTTFVDWEAHDSVGKDYEAFLLTGFDIQGDILRNKQAPYIQCAFNRTETAFVDNGSGGVEFDKPSSCIMEARWDWTSNDVSGKITTPREVYRFKRPFIPGPIGELFANGLPVVTTRSKIRGRGKELHLKFTSPAKFDCQLLGWATDYRGTTST